MRFPNPEHHLKRTRIKITAKRNKKRTHLLDLLPIGIVVQEFAEVLELELQCRHLCSADETLVVWVLHALPAEQIHERKWEPGGRVKRRKDAVCQVLRLLQEDWILGEMVGREQSSKDTYGRLSRSW